MKYPKIVAAFVTGGRVVLHRQTDAETLETVAVAPGEEDWMRAAEAVAHFATSNEPLTD